ncbi:response regulator [Microbacterium sp. NPDC060132]|uniref:response regulator n=1 Tax=Microbacterium sp. NPDC060132 TaxID=3347059 RepID=UPI00365701C3
MFVSMEVITILGSTVTIIVAMASGFGWLVTRMDARFAASDARMAERFAMVEGPFSGMEERMDARFAASDARMDERFAMVEGRFSSMEERMDARFAASDARFAMVEERFSGMDARFGALEERLTGIEHEVTEVRIAVARLEGPPRRLISVR